MFPILLQRLLKLCQLHANLCLILHLFERWTLEKEGSPTNLDCWSAFLLPWFILLSRKYGIIAKTFFQNKISAVFKDITCQISEVYVKFKMADWWQFFCKFCTCIRKLDT